jgi:hypothetical protein
LSLRFLIGVFLVAAAMASAPPAHANRYVTGNYANGWLVPGQDWASTFDDAPFSNWCMAIDNAQLAKDRTGVWGTAGVIAKNGTWTGYGKGTGPYIYAVISPDTLSESRNYLKKAYVKNSDVWWAYTASAYRGYWTSDNINCGVV